LIVHSFDPVVLVGGAYLGPSDLNIPQRDVATFVAVDSGADHLLAHGITPVAVIGDLDSLSDAASAAFADRLHHIAEQSTVDFDKALRNIDAPLIYAVGFAGGRIDHTLAVLNVLGQNPTRPVILLSDDDASMIAPPTGLTLQLPIGTRISLMPLADARVDGLGLVWPILDKAMHPMQFTSPSNAVAADKVEIYAIGPVLVTVPRAHVAALAQGVARAK